MSRAARFWLAGLLLLGSASSVARSPGDIVYELDIDNPPDTSHVLGAGFSFGADVELDIGLQDNLDLDDAVDDTVLVTDPQLELAMAYTPNDRFYGFVNAELARAHLLVAPDGAPRPTTRLDVKEAFVVLRDLHPGVTLQLGRQDFQDEREWFYDEDLDGARLFYSRGRVAAELSVSRQDLFDSDLLNRDPDRRTNNYFLAGHYALNRDSEGRLYLLYRDDRIRSRDDLLLFGLDSLGKLGSYVDYWLNGALTSRPDRIDDVPGFGFDVGATRIWKGPLQPSISAGIAFGTGDENDDDRGFRQTGLQDNNGRFGGVTSFKYYGEVFEPELSNMAIFTAAAAMRPTPKSSVDLVFHHYHQHRASDDLRDSSLQLDPNGTERNLGFEVDLVVGYGEIKNLELELVVGAFIPGSAFPDADTSYRAALELKYALQ